MENLVLYRKYRPKTFSEVIGQEHIVKTLTNAIASGMISHAYLFSGPRGSGKTSIARLLAKAVNCQNRKKEKYEPCDKCSSCLEINQGRAIDLIEIDAASHRGIDDIRELRDGIRFSPTKSKYKVFIIDESHQLTKEADNALLKTLEEPPKHAIFILATTEIQKMIPTIISRCQRFDFRKLTMPEIIKKLERILKEEKIKFEKSALALIALNSGGSMRDAESLLDQTLPLAGPENIIKTQDIKDLLGVVDINIISQWTDYILQKKTAQAIDFLNKTLEKGFDPQEFAKSFINYLREGLILKINPDLENPLISGLTKEEKEKLQSQISQLETDKLSQIIRIFLRAENEMKYSPIPQLPLELAVVEVAEIEK